MTTLGVNFFGGYWGTRGAWMKYPLMYPNQYYRVPFFMSTANNSPLTTPYTSQQAIDLQLDYMNEYGIDYINFDFYPPELDWISGTHAEYKLLNESFRKFQTSTHRGNVKCTFIMLSEHLFFNVYDTSEWVTMVAWLRSFMSQSYWMTVLGGRPLLYFVTRSTSTGWINAYNTQGGAGTAKAAIDSLRAAVLADTGHDPYIVNMAESNADTSCLTELGLDAMSTYQLSPSSGSAGEYRPNTQIITDAQALWAAQLATGKDVVPILSAGWDYSDLCADYALSGAHDYGGENTPAGPWYVQATPAQLGAQWTAAQSFITTNYGAGAGKTRADTAIIYAWDECTEGGWIVPTPYGPYGTQKLISLAAARSISVPNTLFEHPVFNREIFNPYEAIPGGDGAGDYGRMIVNTGTMMLR